MCTELIGIYQLLPSSPIFLHLLVWKGYGIATKKVKMRMIPFLKVSLFQKPVHYYFNLKKKFFFDSAAGGILLPQPGIQHMPPAFEEGSLNHWTTREVLKMILEINITLSS